jgi:hypothetical protein
MGRQLRFGLTALGAALLLFLGGVSQARADIIFNNFGPGDTYNIGFGYTIAGSTVIPPGFVQGDGFAITPAATFELDQIRLAAGHITGPNQINVTLRADAGGLPGAVLESFSFTNLGAFGNANPPLVANSVLHPILQAGTRYWLIADPGNAATWDVWNFNSIGDTGPHALSAGGGPFTDGNATRGAFEILGTPVPEPSSLALFGLGSLGLAGWRLRRRHTSK